MSALQESVVLGLVAKRSQADWRQALADISASIHPVDRESTRIWFAFWPLDLMESLRENPEEMARVMDLEGRWRLSEQIDSSVGFLYGAHFWSRVKKQVLALAGREGADSESRSLESMIREVAEAVASDVSKDVSLTLGISAVGLMMLRQVGIEALESVADHPADGPLLRGEPDAIARQREIPSRDGLLGFLKGAARRVKISWDEARGRFFRAHLEQDVAMAAAEQGDRFRDLDYRRIDGPVPVECRVGSCGYCWVGVVAGKERFAPVSSFEKERLAYFGYDGMQDSNETHPPIRLACQASCLGDATLTIPPWNGELNRRHDATAKKLGVI